MHTYGNADPKSAAYRQRWKQPRLKPSGRPKRVCSRLSSERHWKAYVKHQPREYTPEGGWSLGQNPDFPSDKTLAVVRFDTLSGKPIALLITMASTQWPWAGESPGLGRSGGGHLELRRTVLQGELPETRRGIWAPVAASAGRKGRGRGSRGVWTSGAGGDQNPIALSRAVDFTLVEPLGKSWAKRPSGCRVPFGPPQCPPARGGERGVLSWTRREPARPRAQSRSSWTRSPVNIRLGAADARQDRAGRCIR